MSQKTINSHLRQAAEAVDAARRASLSTEAGGYLDGVEELLTHHRDGGATESEALMYPTPDALDTIQSQLADIIQETDGPAVTELENARAQILEAILLLDERESEGRPTSSWR